MISYIDFRVPHTADVRYFYFHLSLQLTAAVSATESIVKKAYDVPQISKYLDAIHLMTYDMHGSWEPKADHHAPLFKSSWDSNNFNVDHS